MLYSSVDETFLQQIISDYEKRTGVNVQVVGDSEAGKTTGLINRIRLEKDHPRADVFWSSEQTQTMLLAHEGLLARYASPSAEDIPKMYCDPDNLWTGFALRARVVAFDPERIKGEDLPKNWADYARDPWPERVAIANPLFGTTRSHMAAMYAAWGAERFRAYLTALANGGATIADGNAAAVRKVLDGKVDVAFTDSDDVITAKAKGAKLAMIFPDMGDGGTMVIPNTVALLAGAPHPDQARKLIDFILSPEVEEALGRSESGNYPVRTELVAKLAKVTPDAGTTGFAAIADAMPPAIELAREILLK